MEVLFAVCVGTCILRGSMKRNKRYWYYFWFSECVLCGKTYTYKERRYTKKPKRSHKRYQFTQFACGVHFL